MSVDYFNLAKDSIGFLYRSHASLRKSGLDEKLLALADLRVSQINGCAYCSSYHARELRDMGLDQGALDRIVGWRLSNAFDRRQKLVLAWAEGLTSLSGGTADLRDSLNEEFSPKEIADLTTAISLMNALNRLRISLSDEH